MRAALCACVAAPVPAAAPEPIELVPLAPARLDHCRRSALLRPACPRLVPRVRAASLSNLSVELTGRRPLDVFGLERGGEDPRRPRRNRPPQMAHVVVIAGRLVGLVPLREPDGAPVAVRDGLDRLPRAAPLPLGHVAWGGRRGALSLMPPFPHGGMLGNHLVFGWREDGRRYALSLHAWEPLTESVATLAQMAGSLPRPATARRLRRLSPVRRLELPRGRTTVRATIAAPAPPRHAFDVLVVAPERADAAIELVTPGRRRLRVLDSTRACRARRPLRTCFLRFPRLEAVRGGTWTLVVAKRSLPPARVRVDVSFR